MNPSRLVLKTLNVHREEWWLVEKLFIMQFFQGAGIVFFFTAAFSYFLRRFSITQLPYVLIASSFLLWATAYVYHKLEHRFALSKLALVVTLLMTTSIMLFLIGTEFISADWFYYLLLGWFNVLYLLNNLVFWGLASQFYDVRQSKRLFGVIGAGDIPAKFIGNTAVVLVIEYFNINQPLLETKYLLFAGFICLVGSLPILRKISGNKILLPGATQHHSNHIQTSGLKATIKDFTVNALIKRIAAISFIGYVCFLLTNYAFFSDVQPLLLHNQDVSLAAFIAFFYAIARLTALFIKMIFTSRLIRQLGYKTSLLIMPVSLILFMILLLVTSKMANSNKIIFYVFGAATIAIEVLRTSINTPVLLTIMQPLSSTEKLRAHSIVKGIMDPFAYLFSGVLLLVLIRLHLYSLVMLGIILMALSVLCILCIYLANMQYLKTLIKTISSRYFSQDEFDLYGKATLELVEKKIENGNELEVLYVLKMLASQSGDQTNHLVIKALDHPSSKVVSEALNMIDKQNITDASSSVYQVIQKHPDVNIQSEAIKVLGKINYSDEVAGYFINHPERQLQLATIISILNHEGPSSYKKEAETKTEALLASSNPIDRKNAAQIISNIKSEQFDNRLISLLNDADIEVQHSAMQAIGFKSNEQLFLHLIKKITGNEKTVTQALLEAGSLSLPCIKDYILQNQCTEKQKDKLIYLCGRIGSEKGIQTLLNLLILVPQKRTAIIKALHRSHFKAIGKELKEFEAATREYLVYAAEMLHMQKGLHPKQEKNFVLNNSLQIELNEIREILLCLFSFLYDREKINKVKSALEFRKKEAQANAMELLDMTVKKDFAHPFSSIYEQGDIANRCDALKNIFPKDVFKTFEDIVIKILTEGNFSFNTWTKACSLYSSKKNAYKIDQDMIHKYLESENLLLKETARYAI
jgi:ATP:ADP antiporter, AAA family